MKFTQLLLIFSTLFLNQIYAAVMGIDFGTDWIKVGLVKNGVPMDLVLTKDSKRKDDSVVTIRDGGIKRPKDSYGKLKNLMGRFYNDPIAEEYRQSHDNDMIEDPSRKTCSFKHSEDEIYSVEELIAMQLVNARKNVEKFAEEVVKDAVFTVPPFWSQHERQALLDAADLAGIRVLGLINDETAVALNYASTRTFDEKPQYHIFYDFGAGSTVASLIEFRNNQVKVSKYSKSTKNVTVIEVKAMGYDRTLGGYEFDVRLADHLADLFMQTTGKKLKQDIKQNQRAMKKLLREANRVKHILSVNVDAQSSVEGLVDELDFRATITRKKFESICQDLLQRIGKPIDQVLQNSGLKMSDIQSFILVGGSIRLPSVQTKLQEFVGAEKIAKHVNADEAAVLGATLRAAQISPQFKVREFEIIDIAAHTIVSNFESSSGKQISQRVFKYGQNTNLKKKMTFNKQDDFVFTMEYDSKELEQDPHFGSQGIYQVSIQGLSNFMKQNASSIAADAESKTKVLLYLDKDDMLRVESADFEYLPSQPPQKGLADNLKDTVLSFFGSDSDSNSTETDQVDETAGDSNDNKDSESQKNESTVQKNITENSKPEKIKAQKFPLNLTIINLGVKPLSDDQKAVMIKNLKEYEEAEKLRIQREDARNKLEAFVYSFSDFLSKDEVSKVVLPKDVESIKSQLSSTSEWLYEDGELTTTKTDEYLTRYKNLFELQSPIQFRLDEMTDRPEAISDLKSTINQAKDLLFKNFGDPKLTQENITITQDDASSLDTLIKETEEWLTGQVKIQEGLKPFEDPVLISKDIKKKLDELEYQISELKKAIKIFKNKKVIELKKKELEEKKRLDEELARKNQTSNQTIVDEKNNSTEAPQEDETKVQDAEDGTITIQDNIFTEVPLDGIKFEEMKPNDENTERESVAHEEL